MADAFRYDANKAWKQAQQQQAQAAQQQGSQFPFQATIFIFKFDSATNGSVSLGQALFLIRPLAGGWQLMCYKDPANPHFQLPVTPDLKMTVRDAYGYIDQWIIQFPDIAAASRALIVIGTIASKADCKRLSLWDVMVGNGSLASAGSKVKVSYHGVVCGQPPFIGSTFDARDSFAFEVGSESIIRGYTSAVDGMKVGGSRVAIIPPEMAYGARGVPPQIPPNSAIAFLITLLSIEETKPPESAASAPVAAPAPIQTAAASAPSVPAAAPAAPIPTPMTTLEKLQRMGAVSLPGVAKAAALPATPAPSPTPVPVETSAAPAPAAVPPPAPIPVKIPAPAPVPQPVVMERVEPPSSAPRVETREEEVMATVDEAEMLARIKALTDMLAAKLDGATTPPATGRAGDIVGEVRGLALELEDKERRVEELEQLVDELRRSGTNSRLKMELEAATAELEGLRALLRGGRDLRRENEDLREEVRKLRTARTRELESGLSEAKDEVARTSGVSSVSAEGRVREMFLSLTARVVERAKSRLVQAGHPQLTDIVSDVFSECSTEVLRELRGS